MHEKNIKGQTLLFAIVRIITILFPKKDGNIRLKVMRNYVAEALSYNQCETII